MLPSGVVLRNRRQGWRAQEGAGCALEAGLFGMQTTCMAGSTGVPIPMQKAGRACPAGSMGAHRR